MNVLSVGLTYPRKTRIGIGRRVNTQISQPVAPRAADAPSAPPPATRQNQHAVAAPLLSVARRVKARCSHPPARRIASHATRPRARSQAEVQQQKLLPTIRSYLKLYTTIGINAALYDRATTGEGRKVDIGMFDVQGWNLDVD